MVTASNDSDRMTALRAQLDEPEPQPWKGEVIGDELTGTVVSLRQITFKDKRIWQLVASTGDGPRKLMLSGDLVRQLVDEREVQPGDLVAIRFTAESEKTGFKSYKVAVDPSRPRSSAPEPWAAYDGDDVPPPDSEPPF